MSPVSNCVLTTTGEVQGSLGLSHTTQAYNKTLRSGMPSPLTARSLVYGQHSGTLAAFCGRLCYCSFCNTQDLLFNTIMLGRTRHVLLISLPESAFGTLWVDSYNHPVMLTI
ncbi:hypothetical protein TNCV_4319121 [Trichonephila clavipes]|nr:hypothetical protein TNCV_4319121 [Trichonephila clavipes]